ncbi:hypothetical protein PT974_06007 [Cladobotryum mycophilum]|uniref:Uncharacterized protein n=1 Tax=Cladobotryum mycophilum TaxID=491253 RepID=A0ABR0SKB0_9HYPO
MRASTPKSNPKKRSTSLPGPPYPPCIFTTLPERQLYLRLKTVYEKHFQTWDKESRDAWPGLVERASLRPTTSKKVTSHKIVKSLTERNVTWAHVVLLRVIFKENLFTSHKVIKIIRHKYPSANFNTFAYNEIYKTNRTAEIPEPMGEKNKMPKSDDRVTDEDRDGSPSRSPEGDKQEAARMKKEKETSAVIKQEAEEDSPAIKLLDTPQHPSEKPKAPAKRKRTINDADGDAKPAAKPAPGKKTAPSSKAPRKSNAAKRVKKEEDMALKTEEPSPAPKALPPAKKAASSATKVENPIKEITRRLADHDEGIEGIRKLLSFVERLSKATEKRARALEREVQRLAGLGIRFPEEDVKQSIETREE